MKTSQKYKKFKINQLKLSDPNGQYVFCPIVDCENIVRVQDLLNYNQVCPSGHSFCLNCRKEAHQDSCLTYNQELYNSLMNNIRNKNTMKLCPNCEVIIEKNKGCNHMTCINCYYEFCWICMKKYEPGHYSIFNFSACPGMENGK